MTALDSQRCLSALLFTPVLCADAGSLPILGHTDRALLVVIFPRTQTLRKCSKTTLCCTVHQRIPAQGNTLTAAGASARSGSAVVKRPMYTNLRGAAATLGDSPSAAHFSSYLTSCWLVNAREPDTTHTEDKGSRVLLPKWVLAVG